MMNGCIAIVSLPVWSGGFKASVEVSSLEKGLLHGFGDLKDYTQVSIYERFEAGGKGERWYILEVESLGRLLLIQGLIGSEIKNRSLYSAERVVVGFGQNEDVESVQQSLIESGISCEHPFESSRFLYVNATSVESVEELYSLAERVRETVDEGCFVEFDPIAFRTGLVPSDPRFIAQWHHEELQSSEAWKITTGDPSIVVAIVDGGVFPDMAEFEGRLVQGVNLYYEAGVEENPEPHDDFGHGTAVTGLVAANANNGKLGAGVDWYCKIMPVRATKNNAASGSPIAVGIDWAVANGARVINVSWTASESQLLRTSVKNAADNGAVVVAGLGNSGQDVESIPAKANEAIAVGASMRDGTRAVWSNWGAGIDVIAPGEDLITVGERGLESVFGGTSGSTPLVSGAAALLLSINPELNWRGIRDLLAAGAVDQTGDSLDTPGWDEYYGWGRLNVYNSLLLAKVELHIEAVGNDHAKLRWRVPSNIDERVSYNIERSEDMLNWERLSSPDIEIEAAEGVTTANAIVENEASIAGSVFYRVAVDLHIDEG